MNSIYLIGVIFVVFCVTAGRFFMSDRTKKQTIKTENPLKQLDFDLTFEDQQLQHIQNIFNESVQQRNKRFVMFVAGLISGQHSLLTGVPGSGKTFAVKQFAALSGLTLGRIQGTPDLLSGDMTGSEIFNQQISDFEFKPGPLFNNIILVDEINRLSPKVLSGLLQAMAEGQISIGNKTYDLPKPFLVIGTMNPYDQFGTYRLPQAIHDRFGFIDHQPINDFDPSKIKKDTESQYEISSIDRSAYQKIFTSGYHSLDLESLQSKALTLGIEQPTSRQLIALNDYFNFCRLFVGK